MPSRTFLCLAQCFIVLCCFAPTSWSYQQSDSDSIIHRQHLSLEALQIKESLNLGLVFTGPQIVYAHSWGQANAETSWVLTSEIGAGVVFSRGIMGANIHLMPARWQYKWKVAPALFVGTVLAAEYNYQLYPDLQSGFSYWFSCWSAGVAVEYQFQAFDNDWRIAGTTSLLGLTSRPPEARNPYFFDLGFAEAVRYLHQNITFGSVNQFTRTSIELMWKPRTTTNIGISYTADVDVYFLAPRWTTLRQGIKVTF